jgi:type IV pilus assembly protein PilN
MIRINLLSVERERTKKKAVFQSGQKVTVACSLVLVITVVFIGWRYLSLSKDSAQLDTDITNAQQEATRLHGIILQVQQYEQQKAQLQQRVGLIEQLRKSQTGPVHMLDQISRSLPPMLWLTDLKQDDKDNSITIDGRTMTLTSLSDFVANLEASGYFKKSVEIVSSQTEAMAAPPGEIVKFSVKGLFAPPGEAAAKAAQPPAVRK